MFNYTDKKEENIFLNMFSTVNKIFTMEDYLFLDNIPQDIWNYLYISNGVDVKGKYLRYEDSYINLFIIRNEDQFIYSDIIFTNRPTVVIVIPIGIEFSSKEELDNGRVNIIKSIYKSIFNYLSESIKVDSKSSLGVLLQYAPTILSLLTEYYTNTNPATIDYFIGKDITKEIINKCLESNVEDLFKYGGLIAILNESNKG